MPYPHLLLLSSFPSFLWGCLGASYLLLSLSFFCFCLFLFILPLPLPFPFPSLPSLLICPTWSTTLIWPDHPLPPLSTRRNPSLAFIYSVALPRLTCLSFLHFICSYSISVFLLYLDPTPTGCSPRPSPLPLRSDLSFWLRAVFFACSLFSVFFPPISFNYYYFSPSAQPVLFSYLFPPSLIISTSSIAISPGPTSTRRHRCPLISPLLLTPSICFFSGFWTNRLHSRTLSFRSLAYYYRYSWIRFRESFWIVDEEAIRRLRKKRKRKTHRQRWLCSNWDLLVMGSLEAGPRHRLVLFLLPPTHCLRFYINTWTSRVAMSWLANVAGVAI